MLEFTTPAIATVTTLDAGNLKDTSASVAAEVNIAKESLMQDNQGFKYGTSADDPDQTASCEITDGGMTVVPDGLEVGSTYYFMAYVTTVNGEVDGEILSFTTGKTGVSSIDAALAATIAVSGNVIISALRPPRSPFTTSPDKWWPGP